jgi:lipoate-protein ligase A
MNYLELTLPTPAENLACDEALLEAAEAGEGEQVLRFWEPRQPFVVLGYANKVATEVNVTACAEARVPVLRRCSGGGTVLQGPGCLNYALVLRIDERLGGIGMTNLGIMTRHQQALARALDQPVAVKGVTDLTLAGRKFSGNSQRRHRRFLLFHGTFLLQLDLALIERCLLAPARQPDYRKNRAHADFLVNLYRPAESIKQALRESWQADQALEHLPGERLDTLSREKYTRDEWNFKF